MRLPAWKVETFIGVGHHVCELSVGHVPVGCLLVVAVHVDVGDDESVRIVEEDAKTKPQLCLRGWFLERLEMTVVCNQRRCRFD